MQLFRSLSRSSSRSQSRSESTRRPRPTTWSSSMSGMVVPEEEAVQPEPAPASAPARAAASTEAVQDPQSPVDDRMCQCDTCLQMLQKPTTINRRRKTSTGLPLQKRPSMLRSFSTKSRKSFQDFRRWSSMSWSSTYSYSDGLPRKSSLRPRSISSSRTNSFDMPLGVWTE